MCRIFCRAGTSSKGIHAWHPSSLTAKSVPGCNASHSSASIARSRSFAFPLAVRHAWNRSSSAHGTSTMLVGYSTFSSRQYRKNSYKDRYRISGAHFEAHGRIPYMYAAFFDTTCARRGSRPSRSSRIEPGVSFAAPSLCHRSMSRTASAPGTITV